jgi:excisionase family DNA binding protein
MPTLTRPASALPPHQLSSGLHFALENVAQSLAVQLTEAIAARTRQANSSAIGQVVSDVLPGFLEREFTQGLLKNQGAARKRRAVLMHVLTAADVQAVMGDPAAAPDETPISAGTMDEDEPLTSETAAKLLHVSRTHVNALLDAGMLGEVSRTAGGHRRVSKAAVLAYKAASKARQAEGLDSMARASQRLGLYEGELAGVPRRAKR